MATNGDNTISESFEIVNGTFHRPHRDEHEHDNNGHEVAQFHDLKEEEKEEERQEKRHEGEECEEKEGEREREHEEREEEEKRDYQHEQQQKEIGEEVKEVEEEEVVVVEEEEHIEHREEEKEEEKEGEEEVVVIEKHEEEQAEKEAERARQEQLEKEKEKEAQRQQQEQQAERERIAMEKERQREQEEAEERQRQRDQEEQERKIKREQEEQARREDPKYRAEEFKLQGNDFFQKKEYRKAAEMYTTAIELHKDAIYYSNRAACYLALAPPNFELALEDATTATELKPDFGRGHTRRAKALQGLKRYEEAKAAAYQAAKVDDKQRPEVDPIIKQIDEELSRSYPVEIEVEEAKSRNTQQKKPSPVSLGGLRKRTRRAAHVKKTRLTQETEEEEEDKKEESEEEEEEEHDEEKEHVEEEGDEEEEEDEGVETKPKHIVSRNFWYIFPAFGFLLTGAAVIFMKLIKYK